MEKAAQVHATFIDSIKTKDPEKARGNSGNKSEEDQAKQTWEGFQGELVKSLQGVTTQEQADQLDLEGMFKQYLRSAAMDVITKNAKAAATAAEASGENQTTTQQEEPAGAQSEQTKVKTEPVEDTKTMEDPGVLDVDDDDEITKDWDNEDKELLEQAKRSGGGSSAPSKLPRRQGNADASEAKASQAEENDSAKQKPEEEQL